MPNLKIIFLGTSQFALPALEALIKNKYNLIAVFTKPDKEEGRGMKISFSPVKQYLKDKGLLNKKVKLFQPPTFKGFDFNELKKLKPDLAIVAAYGLLLPDQFLALPKFGCLNLHPSLLPQYRGPSPIQSAILNQESETGVSVIKLTAQMDAGDIVAQEFFKLSSTIRNPELTQTLSRINADLLIKTIPDYVSGKIRPTAQNEKKATYTKLFQKEDGHIDWNNPARKIEAMTRALDPWPGAYTFFVKENKENLKIDIIEAKVKLQNSDSTKNKNLVAGEVFKLNEQIAIKCAESILVLKKIKPEGKKIMAVNEFINGHQNFIGSILN